MTIDAGAGTVHIGSVGKCVGVPQWGTIGWGYIATITCPIFPTNVFVGTAISIVTFKTLTSLYSTPNPWQ